jgi:uncharacterized alkaline shock family protein YloU
MRVTEVNISVNDVLFQEERPEPDEQRELQRKASQQEQRA